MRLEKVAIPHAVLDWVLDGPDWMKYVAGSFINGPSEELRQKSFSDPNVRQLVKEVGAWPWPRISSHKSAAHPLHKLVFMADIGATWDDDILKGLPDKILNEASADGVPRLVMNVPKHFGGSGEDGLAWALCDAPSLTYALARMGLRDDPRIERAAARLESLGRENGFPCACSLELGRFRGPGRKDDPCPYATLAMLKLLSELPEHRDGRAAQAGVECLLSLWKSSRERHPYQFYMGTDFRKLKAPFVWYDIMNVAEVLTRFPFALGDGRLTDMLSIIWSKRDAQGRFSAESVWTDWKAWEFGQKKQPSRWITLWAYKIMARAAQSNL